MFYLFYEFGDAYAQMAYQTLVVDAIYFNTYPLTYNV